MKSWNVNKIKVLHLTPCMYFIYLVYWQHCHSPITFLFRLFKKQVGKRNVEKLPDGGRTRRYPSSCVFSYLLSLSATAHYGGVFTYLLSHSEGNGCNGMVQNNKIPTGKVDFREQEFRWNRSSWSLYPELRRKTILSQDLSNYRICFHPSIYFSHRITNKRRQKHQLPVYYLNAYGDFYFLGWYILVNYCIILDSSDADGYRNFYFILLKVVKVNIILFFISCYLRK